MQNLTPADHAHLRFLRGQVDRLQDESFRLDPHPNVKQDLARARSELKSFVLSLQKEGKSIHGWSRISRQNERDGKVRYEIKEENKSQYGKIIPVPFFLKEKNRYKEQVIYVKY